MRKTAIVGAVLMLAGCADKFLTAKITIQTGRLVTNMAQMAFDEAYKAQKAICEKDMAKVTECMAKIEKAKKVFTQSKATADASWNAAEATVKAAELKKEGQKVDWVSLVRKGVCAITEALKFIPEKHRKKIDRYLNLLNAYGCLR
jgi:hypothetical protein